ncbi:MAG: type IV secretion system DNA-binding domain-containing protein [Deltaproteobacteria bacterium]|nr:type IV secretion system DNA-binding domain-containing protein [Deltaproteobacteria bacterium]
MNDTPLLNRIAPYLPMYAAGGWYTLPSFTAWLDGPQMYRASFYRWYWHTAIKLGGFYGLGTWLFPLACLALVMMWRWQRDPDGSEHLRGLRLVSPREFNRTMNGGFIRQMVYGHPCGMQISGITIPESIEFEHFLIIGNSGAGKSTAIRSMLDQIQERGQPAIVIDRESEYVQQYYNEARGDVILNPLDRRCPYWSPWSELRDDSFTVDAAAIAASLIRGRARTNNEAFFQESTRTVIEAILHVMRDQRNTDDLLRFVGLPREQLHEALQGTPAYALIDPKAAEQGSGILGTAANALKTFAHLPKHDQTGRTWSAREWAQNRQGWVFLPSREDLHDSIQMLQGLWLDSLVRWLMSAEIGSQQTWIIADELASLGHQPQIEKLLTRGRKRGLAVVLGLQSVAQLQAIYGREGSVTLTSSPSTKLIMRVDETECAKWASELIGSHEVERLTMTQLTGLSTYREGVNLQPHRTIEPLVLADEIKLLQRFTGYLCIAGAHRTTIRIPQLYLTKHQEPFIPRPTAAVETTATATPEPTDDEIVAQLTARP